MNRFDVIIPCYNYGRYLRTCVQSVLTQRDVSVRVLIIDDCSSDNTETVGTELAASDSRVEYRRHAANRGHTATYNEGLLEWAAGDYCLLLSADDMLAAGALARAAEVFDANPRVGLVFGDAPKTTHPEDSAISTPDVRRARVTVQNGRTFLESMCREALNSVPTPTAVVRTALQQRIGGYCAQLPHACDFEMWLRCSVYADVALVHATQAFYRVHTSQMSVGYVGLRDFREVQLAFDELFATHGAGLEDGDRLRQSAYRGLALRAYWTGAHLFDAGDTTLMADYLALALELCPELRHERLWRNFQVKQLLGPRLWRVAKRLVRATNAPSPSHHHAM